MEMLWLNEHPDSIPTGTLRDGDGRVILRVDDMPRLVRDGKPLTMRDESTGADWEVWAVDCGLNCFCAAGGRPVASPVPMTVRDPAAAWSDTAVVDADTGLLHCAVDGCGGEIVEVDRAVRWNRLYMEGDALFASTGDGVYEHDSYSCDTCLREHLLPAGMQIEDWT